MRIFTKKAAVAGSLIMALGLTGCFQDVPSDQDRKPATSAPTKSTKGEMPDTPKYEDTKELDGIVDPDKEMTAEDLASINENNKEFAEKFYSEIEAKPFGVDPEVLINDWSTPEVKEVFKEFDTKEGVRFGLDFMQKTLAIGKYFEERDASKDYEPLVGFEEMMTIGLQEDLKKRIAEDGRITMVPSSHGDGEINFSGDLSEPKVYLATHPIYNIWADGVSVDGEFLQVVGKGEMTIFTKDENVFVPSFRWSMNLIPVGENEWRVDGFSWRITGGK